MGNDCNLGQSDTKEVVRSGKSLNIFLNVQLTGYVMGWLWDARESKIKDPQDFGQSQWKNEVSVN